MTPDDVEALLYKLDVIIFGMGCIGGLLLTIACGKRK
jgi:hypothetical protein